eukprot:7579271-Pyramimonas_sp.AAC.1
MIPRHRATRRPRLHCPPPAPRPPPPPSHPPVIPLRLRPSPPLHPAPPQPSPPPHPQHHSHSASPWFIHTSLLPLTSSVVLVLPRALKSALFSASLVHPCSSSCP